MDKEKLFASVRTKIAAVATAVVTLITFLSGLFPDVLAGFEVDPEKLAMLVDFITWVVVAVVIGRTFRNTPMSGGK